MSTSSTPPPTPKVGVASPTLIIDPATGDGVLSWVFHAPNGNVVDPGPVPMTAEQISYAIARLPGAAALLHTQLTASGGAATPEIIATTIAEALSWLHVEGVAPAPVTHTGTDTLA